MRGCFYNDYGMNYGDNIMEKETISQSRMDAYSEEKAETLYKENGKRGNMYGRLSQYADPAKWEQEKGAYERYVINKIQGLS